MIKVAITDDHPIVVDGLTNALSSGADILLSGVYSNAASLLKGIQQQPVDVLLLDLQLPDKNGSELVPILLQQYPSLHILILSGIEASPYIRDMMQRGCKGYLVKSRTNQAMLLEAIREVASGAIYLDASLKEDLLREMLVARRRSEKSRLRITLREKEVLGLILKEYNNPAIAEALCISLRTVETHRYNLMQKLEAKNTASLIRIATELGLHY
ncbi:response regulator [Taibaiella helva]|uniref:response regulator n=1 Tax=Taibaiella helva TaxID=2301235 RepID=UPI000E58ABC1|nr:response regulator transcription factor [Taibaiella helva]